MRVMAYLTIKAPAETEAGDILKNNRNTTIGTIWTIAYILTITVILISIFPKCCFLKNSQTRFFLSP